MLRDKIHERYPNTNKKQNIEISKSMDQLSTLRLCIFCSLYNSGHFLYTSCCCKNPPKTGLAGKAKPFKFQVGPRPAAPYVDDKHAGQLTLSKKKKDIPHVIVFSVEKNIHIFYCGSPGAGVAQFRSRPAQGDGAQCSTLRHRRSCSSESPLDQNCNLANNR